MLLLVKRGPAPEIFIGAAINGLVGALVAYGRLPSIVVTLGTLVAFITMMLSLVWPIASLGFLLSMTQESFTAANRIAEFDVTSEVSGATELSGEGGSAMVSTIILLPW